MRRDELLERLRALPAGVDVGVKVGGGHVDIADVVRWGDGRFGAVMCHLVDLNDLLIERGLSASQRRRVVSEEEDEGDRASRIPAIGAERAAGMPLRLAGLAEIRALLGVDARRVAYLMESAGFPEPMARLDAGRVWDLDDVDEWRAKRGHIDLGR